jgi:hypothetical protein
LSSSLVVVVVVVGRAEDELDGDEVDRLLTVV